MQSPALVRLRSVVMVWFSIGIALALRLGAASGAPLIDKFSAVEVGAEVVGWTGFQDANGTVFFGSSSLIAFNGAHWRSYPMGTSYAVRGLDMGPDGKIWAGATGELGWFEFAQGAWQYNSLLKHFHGDARALSEVWHAFSFGKGAVFATVDTLLYWDGLAFRTWSMPDTRHIRAIKTQDGIFIQHIKTGLYLMTETGPELIPGSEVLNKLGIFWMARQGAGWIMITSKGLYRFERGALSEIPSAATNRIREQPLTAVIQLPNGDFALGTMNNGIFFANSKGDVLAVLNKETGFNSTYTAPLLVDRDGQLWAGGTGTFFRIALNGSSTIYTEIHGYPGHHVSKIGRHEGRLTLASFPNLYQLDERLSQFLPIEAGVPSPRNFLKQGDALFVGGFRGLARQAPQKTEIVYASEGDILAMGVSQTTPNAIYAADSKGIFEVSAQRRPRLVASGLPDAAASLVEDNSGTLWIGTRGFGLFSARTANTNGTADFVSPKSGLINSQGTATVSVTRGGHIFVFNATGAWLLDQGQAKFNHVLAAPARQVISTAPDPRRSALWVLYPASANKTPAIALITADSTGAQWLPHEVEGLADIGVPRAIFAEEEGAKTVLWIAGTLGLLRHQFEGPLSAPKPREPVMRTYVRAEKGEFSELTKPLPYSTRSVEIEFAAPESSRRRLLRIENKIDGLETNWTPVPSTGYRELNALREGTYTVRARVVAETGAASEETSRTFTVLPPWWRTQLAMAGFSIVALGTISGGVWLRIRSLRRRTILLEKKVRERTEELERASAAKTEFVANMSHDIRNPLNGIVGLALALEDTRLDMRQREIVATLRECTTYLSTLVDDVLDFASIEAGKVELRPAPFAAGQLLYSVVMALKGETAERGAKLLVEIDPHLPASLVGDAGRIQQILVNYVSNALKYAGGTIVISAKVPLQNPGEVEFSVSDSGRGISMEEQATLFTKFSRLDGARHTDVPGTGLGLASCRALADLMGGSVGVVSQLNKGSRFFLRLPLEIGTAAAIDEERQLLPDTHVLLVEDTDYNAWAASAVLAKLGLACERARNGEEALRMFAEKRFNVVLLDRNLPDMDGTEVARSMRKLEAETGAIPAVLLAATAYCTAEDRKLCLDSGMDAFVGKPLTPEKLRRVLIGAARRMLSSATLDVAPDIKTGPIDTSMLAYLADEDTPGALDRQIDRFVEELAIAGTKLTDAAASGDSKDIGDAAHRLVGHARMVGGGPLAEAASLLERHARAGDLSACNQSLARVDDEIRAITAALRHRRTLVQSA